MLVHDDEVLEVLFTENVTDYRVNVRVSQFENEVHLVRLVELVVEQTELTHVLEFCVLLVEVVDEPPPLIDAEKMVVVDEVRVLALLLPLVTPFEVQLVHSNEILDEIV